MFKLFSKKIHPLPLESVRTDETNTLSSHVLKHHIYNSYNPRNTYAFTDIPRFTMILESPSPAKLDVEECKVENLSKDLRLE